jgi:hypothetical protein
MPQRVPAAAGRDGAPRAAQAPDPSAADACIDLTLSSDDEGGGECTPAAKRRRVARAGGGASDSELVMLDAPPAAAPLRALGGAGGAGADADGVELLGVAGAVRGARLV